MTVFRRGDVVLVAFPFTDLTTTKMRPALIVSSDVFNHKNSDVIVVAITSQLSRRISDYHYLLSSQEQSLAGLPKPSMIKLGKIVTLDQRLIRRKLGRVPDAPLALVTMELHKLLQ